MTNLEKIKLNELLEEVQKRGFISTRKELVIDRTYKFPKPKRPFKIGIVSDTHLGSTCQQITFLHEAYRIMKERGIKKVLHAGDLIEGNGKLFRGQVYEMFLHGADSMINYAIKNYPQEKGITTYIIGGSHDYSFYKEDGLDVLQRVSEARPDIKYLGMYGAYLQIGKILIYLMHGSGGVAYARSYRMQKIIEQFPPEKKPHILLLGHYHVQCHIPTYRNVAGFMLPCFQTQTNYLMAKGLFPEIGFVILTITPDDKGIFSYKTEWHPFYIPITRDY
jgi:DNA repair exonuclease SbcCD nuclease subunit